MTACVALPGLSRMPSQEVRLQVTQQPGCSRGPSVTEPESRSTVQTPAPLMSNWKTPPESLSSGWLASLLGR